MLYQRFGYPVFRRCLVLLAEEAAAMDMAQEVFVKTMSRPLRFASNGQARQWLMRVATNLSLNELRRRKYWRSEELQDQGSSRNSLDRLVADRGLVRHLLGQTEPELAVAGIGYYLEGKTAAEVAEDLEVSVPTARRRIRAFLDFARGQLGIGEEET